MGIGLRVFYIKDDDSIVRISWPRYEKLIYRKPGGNFPDFAGEKVRFAQVGVVFENRKPISVCYDNYYILTFDSQGWPDKEIHHQERRLMSEVASQPMLHPFFRKHEPNVIDANNRFAKRRYEYLYKWKPSEKIVAQIGLLIFG